MTRQYRKKKSGYPFSHSTGRLLHCKARALERYGIRINKRDLSRIVGMIQRGESTKVWHKNETNTRKAHVLTYRGRRLKVMYVNSDHEVATFLPIGDH